MGPDLKEQCVEDLTPLYSFTLPWEKELNLVYAESYHVLTACFNFFPMSSIVSMERLGLDKHECKGNEHKMSPYNKLHQEHQARQEEEVW